MQDKKRPTSDEAFLCDGSSDKTFIKTSCCALGRRTVSQISNYFPAECAYHEAKTNHTEGKSPVECFARCVC